MLWLLAIHQTQNNRQGTMHGAAQPLPIQVSTGATYSLAIREGQIFSWGYNIYGETDILEQYQDQEFIQISAGRNHSLGILDDGRVVSWGSDSPEIPDKYQDQDFIQVAAGGMHSLGILARRSSCLGE